MPAAAFAKQREVGLVIAEEGMVEAERGLDVVLHFVIRDAVRRAVGIKRHAGRVV